MEDFSADSDSLGGVFPVPGHNSRLDEALWWLLIFSSSLEGGHGCAEPILRGGDGLCGCVCGWVRLVDGREASSIEIKQKSSNVLSSSCVTEV
jgi:hypothetical protein